MKRKPGRPKARNHPAPPDTLSGSPVPWQLVEVLRAPTRGDFMQVKKSGEEYIWAYIRHDVKTRQVTSLEDSPPSDVEADKFQRWARSVLNG